MTHEEKKHCLEVAEQAAGIDPYLGYRLACKADATESEARAILTPIAFHLLEREGRDGICLCGEEVTAGSPWKVER